MRKVIGATAGLACIAAVAFIWMGHRGDDVSSVAVKEQPTRISAAETIPYERDEPQASTAEIAPPTMTQRATRQTATAETASVVADLVRDSDTSLGDSVSTGSTTAASGTKSGQNDEYETLIKEVPSYTKLDQLFDRLPEGTMDAISAEHSIRDFLAQDPYGSVYKVSKIDCRDSMCQMYSSVEAAQLANLNAPDADWDALLYRMHNQEWWKAGFTEDTTATTHKDGKIIYVTFLIQKSPLLLQLQKETG